MKLVYMSIFILTTVVAHAQTNSKAITYFNKDWQVVESKKESTFYRKVESIENKYVVKDFFSASDSLRMEAMCSAISPRLIKDGTATFYHKNGSISNTGFYIKDLPTGLHKSFYSNGSPRSIKVYGDEEERYVQYWSATGEPALVNSTGLIIENNNQLKSLVYNEIKDSILLRSYALEQNNDTLYYYTQTPAEYTGGMELFYKGISQTIVYPKAAQRDGVEGKVFVKFIVDEQGAVKEISVLTGIGSGCDEAAVAACLKQKDWQPGRFRNKPVKMIKVLPIVFRLE